MAAQAPSAIPAGDIAVEIRGVRKTFTQRQRTERFSDALRNLVRPRVREVHALDGVDLTVARGEVVAYAGPNGAGKSTTVKLLSALLAPDEGTVRVLGMDPVADRVRYVSRIGVVFGQRTELWWDHPVAASFDWKRVVWDVPRERYDTMLGYVRETLGLDGFFQTTARELSLGQKMRAEIGLALVHSPEILFLDEPTIGLDVLAKQHVLEFVTRLNRERGVTVVVTSHDMSDLEQLAGRVVMIDRGRIAYDGDWRTLRRQAEERRHLVIETDGVRAPVLVGAAHISTDGGRHEYVFDPSRVRITDLLEQASTQAEVRDVESHRPPIDEVIAGLYASWGST
jgi:ABC-2 type transport system ATP-binding protein